MTTQDIMKEYIPYDANGYTHLEICLYYSVGGRNVFTGREEQRGYYLSVAPVKRERGMISFTAFTGKKICILPCQRKSEKKKEEAKTICLRDKDIYIVKYFPDAQISR